MRLVISRLVLLAEFGLVFALDGARHRLAAIVRPRYRWRASFAASGSPRWRTSTGRRGPGCRRISRSAS